ncbi:DNA cytosine methyltransferase [Nocardioides astragali]|uniref:DNA (cytosine-5-)-methyltransferase n=1 Tax=Nocardioides astragali TaxID=1776736 RepID=A0ABW2N4N5_9ACTN|nr:DNA (cytosine-5-)-methyltransferase [Nocardioides astragali]
MTTRMTGVGLFAGIGGVEEGLRRSGASDAVLLVDNWTPSQQVLADRFPHADLQGDVAVLKSSPKVDVMTAGFPCTDLSQAGRTAGIGGKASGLVTHVFRLLESAQPTWLVFENVRNMLVLDGGKAMRYLVDSLEERGYRWAYRLVDSRSVGVAQRRQRVIMVASQTENPADVLLVDDAGEPGPDFYKGSSYGFYWTEGLRGLGWAHDAVPTLKGGSTVGIPSPPAIWVPDGPEGHKLVMPRIEEAEELQGFARGWTQAADLGRTNGPRWKLVGNAVTVGISEWLGRRLVSPSDHDAMDGVRVPGGKWPLAAWGGNGEVFESPVSMWPEQAPYKHLLETVDVSEGKPLSHRAAAGFKSRMERSTLRFDPQFRADVSEHVAATA